MFYKAVIAVEILVMLVSALNYLVNVFLGILIHGLIPLIFLFNLECLIADIFYDNVF